MNEKELQVAEKIKGMLVENLRIPEEELDYEIALFGMTGVGKEHFFNITALTKYVVEHME